MKAVLMAAAVSLVVTLLGTPLFIKFLVRRDYGQFIRDDGPTSHHTKRGTPTMGGAVIIGASLLAYGSAHLLTGTSVTVSGVLVLFLMAGLGIVGFLDDYIKISKQRSLGLRTKEKLAGQSLVGVIFAVLALQFPNSRFRTPAVPFVSFARDTNVNFAFAGTLLGLLLFVLWANLMISATSNGVNLTDGLDGLATGTGVMVFGAYVFISIWQFNQNCQFTPGVKCYEVRDPRDLAVVAAARSCRAVGGDHQRGGRRTHLACVGSARAHRAVAGAALRHSTVPDLQSVLGAGRCDRRRAEDPLGPRAGRRCGRQPGSGRAPARHRPARR